MNMAISFGQAVRERRGAIGLTQTELARRAGCAPVTVRKIEADLLRPSVQLADFLSESDTNGRFGSINNFLYDLHEKTRHL